MKKSGGLIITVIFTGLVALFTTGCGEDPVPTVTTADVTEIGLAGAVGGGTVTDDGGTVITERGICWSTTDNPTVNDSIIIDQGSNNSFTVNISGLKWATTYYLRAYATNNIGTAYGNSVTFTTKTPEAIVYIDDICGDDKVEEALIAQRCNVKIETIPSIFAADLASGNYNLAVLMTQGSATSDYSGNIPTTIISDYLATGNPMIYATWCYSLDGSYAALFDASFTGSGNKTTITLTDDLMISELGASSFTLTNTGYGTFSAGLSATTGGSVLATFENGDGAIILGNEGHTMMLGFLSDTPASNNQELFESILVKLNASL